MKMQLVCNQSSNVGLHVKPSPARPRQLIAHKLTAPCLAAQNKYLDFSVGSFGHGTRIPRRAAASGTNGTTSAETAPQGIYANIDFRFNVKDICELTVFGSLEGTASRGPTSLVALYNFYFTRSKMLAASVVEILENADASLQLKLNEDIDMNSLLQRLKNAPESSLKTLDSMKILMTLCQRAAPAVAQQVENSMRAEYLTLKEKAASEARSGSSTDTPFNVLASDFKFTEGNKKSGSSVEHARQAPIMNAIKLASSPYWDTWKFQLRSALISSPTPPPKTAYAASFCINTRTSDDIEMNAWLDVLAGGSLSLGRIATNGPSQDDDPVLKSFLLLEYLHYPESSMLDALSSMCWKVALIPSPEKFSLTFFKCGQKDNTKSAIDGTENEFVIQGSGEELKVLLMALAGLESGELVFGTGGGQIKKKKALTPWIPANERLQVRRLHDGSSYEMRAALIDREAGDSEESVVLCSRQVLAVIDCLDAFCELHPSFGLNTPNVEWPKTPMLQQLAASLRL